MIGCICTGLVLVGLFVAFGVAWENDSPVRSLIQRITLITGFGWIAALSVYLYQAQSTR